MLARDLPQAPQVDDRDPAMTRADRPRFLQLPNARVTVARDVPARLASSSCDNGITRWIARPLWAVPFGQIEQEGGEALPAGGDRRRRSIVSVSFHFCVTTRR